nr:MAG TPA: hypothetical protein [Caudoviricetes sp.]
MELTSKDSCQDDYQGELNSLIYQEQLYSEKIKLQEKNSVFFGNTIFSKYDHWKLLLVQVKMTYISFEFFFCDMSINLSTRDGSVS